MSQWNVCREELLGTCYKNKVEQIKNKIGIIKLKKANSINRPKR